MGVMEGGKYEMGDYPAVARALEMVGDRWTLLILREAFLGVRRFERMRQDLGIARNVLADRLGKLVGAGVLERRRYQERPDRYEYRLTEKGSDIYPVLVSLLQWAGRYEAEDHETKVILEHKGCGNRTVPLLVCSECGERLQARDVRAKVEPDTLDDSA